MLIIAGIMESYRSLKDKTLKITFETNEPTGEQLVQIASLMGDFGWLAFKKDHFKEKEVEILDSLKSDYQDNGKSKAQRLRAVLYRCWETDNLGYEVFDDYYNNRMEHLIMHFKGKLE